MSRPEPHQAIMARALARAAAGDGWIETPDLPLDYRGPVEVPFEPFGEAGMARPALASLRCLVALRPTAAAISGDSGGLDFAGLWQAAARLAWALRDAPEGPVAILLPGGPTCLAALLGCWAAGRMALLLDPGFPSARNLVLLRLGSAALVLAEAGAEATAAGLPWLPVPTILAGPTAPMPPDAGWLALDAPGCILFTSGSTGLPKAIVHSQASLLFRARNLVDQLHLSVRDRVLLLAGPASITGAGLMLATLSGCALRLLLPGAGGYRAVLAALRQGPTSVLWAAPSLLRSLARLPAMRPALAGVRAVLMAGEALPLADLPALRACLPEGCLLLGNYASTEAPGLVWFARPADAQDPLRVPAGLLRPHTAAMIVDATGRPCLPGEAGELLLRSRYTALGEWQDGRVAPGRLQPDPHDPAVKLYRTGDLARLTPDGVFLVLGRLDRMVQVNAQRVEPAEIEAVLRAEPGVQDAAVVATTGPAGAALRGFVVAPGLDAADLLPALRQRVAAALPAAFRLSRLHLLPALPRLPGGKLDEAALLVWEAHTASKD